MHLVGKLLRAGSHALSAGGTVARRLIEGVVATSTTQRKTRKTFLLHHDTAEPAKRIQVGTTSGMMRALGVFGYPGGYLKDVHSGNLVLDFEGAEDGATYVAMPQHAVRYDVTLAVPLDDDGIEETTYTDVTQAVLLRILDRHGATGFMLPSGGPVTQDVMRMSDGGGPYQLVLPGKPNLSKQVCVGTG